MVVADGGTGAGAVSVLLNTTTLVEASNVSAFPPTPMPAPKSWAVAVGDVNGDGKPDIVLMGAFASYYVAVLLNTTPPGSQMPSFATQKLFAIPGNQASLTLADVNGDGKPDIVIGGANVAVLLNTTPTGAAIPSFAAYHTFAAGPSIEKQIAATDINGDGKPDLVVINYNGFATVLLNTTAPGSATVSFAPPQTFAAGIGPVDMAVADLNGDGKPDLIIDNHQNTYTFSVLLDTTSPGSNTVTFAPLQTFPAGGRSLSLAVADLNGDGKPDVVVGSESGAYSFVNTKSPGTSTVTFAPKAGADAHGSHHVALADINGDGKPDLISFIYGYVNGTNNVVVNLNTTPPGATTASFATAQSLNIPSFSSVAVRDINGDGRPDLIFPTTGTILPVALNLPATSNQDFATAIIQETAQFTAAGETIDETAGTFSVPVSISLASPVDTTIPFTIGGSGVSGTNDTGITVSPLVIPAGQTTAAITGTLLDDGKYNVNKTLTFTLGTPTNAILGVTTANTLIIQNSHPAAHGINRQRHADGQRK